MVLTILLSPVILVGVPNCPAVPQAEGVLTSHLLIAIPALPVASNIGARACPNSAELSEAELMVMGRS
jgi:hypothetical protein